MGLQMAEEANSGTTNVLAMWALMGRGAGGEMRGSLFPSLPLDSGSLSEIFMECGSFM